MARSPVPPKSTRSNVASGCCISVDPEGQTPVKVPPQTGAVQTRKPPERARRGAQAARKLQCSSICREWQNDFGSTVARIGNEHRWHIVGQSFGRAFANSRPRSHRKNPRAQRRQARVLPRTRRTRAESRGGTRQAVL